LCCNNNPACFLNASFLGSGGGALGVSAVPSPFAPFGAGVVGSSSVVVILVRLSVKRSNPSFN
jgi:hypothetical protein